MLTWQNDTPRFVAKGIVGDRMTFFFGSTNIDDIDMEEFDFVIQLFEHDGAWSVYTEWHQWGEQDRKPKVEAFLLELNQALKTRRNFDFSKYWQDWRCKDSHFDVVVRNTLGNSQNVV